MRLKYQNIMGISVGILNSLTNTPLGVGPTGTWHERYLWKSAPC